MTIMTVRDFEQALLNRAVAVLRGEVSSKEFVTVDMFTHLIHLCRIQNDVDLPDRLIARILGELGDDGVAERNLARATVVGEVFGLSVALYDHDNQLLHGRKLKARRAILASIVHAGQIWTMYCEDEPLILNLLLESEVVEFSDIIGPNILSWVANQDNLPDGCIREPVRAWAKSKSLQVSPADWGEAILRIRQVNQARFYGED